MFGNFTGKRPVSSESYRALYQYIAAEIASVATARELFQHIAGFAPHQLATMGEHIAPTAQWEQAAALLKRLKAGEPLQYLLKEWDFYGRTFQVGEGVLIPRSDTETLVSVALEKLRDFQQPAVLDLCAGSGCIGITVALEQPTASVTAVELSEDAFAYLLKNNEQFNNPVTAVLGDALTYQPPEPVQMIVSNPPYIPTGDLAGLQKEVQKEPVLALDGGEDGLYFYRALTKRGELLLGKGGFLLFEVGIHQSETVSEILASAGFQNIQAFFDLSGIPRVVLGQKNS